MGRVATWLRSARASLVASALVVALCAPLLWWATDHYETLLVQGRHRSVENQLELRSRALSNNFARVVATLDAMAAVAENNEDFETLAQGLRANLPWVRAFQLVQDGVITHVYPLAGNERSLGYRLLGDPRPVVGGDLLRALETGRVTITGPIELVQGGLGLIVRKPFERTGTSRGRLAALVCNTDDFLRESLLSYGELSSDGLELALRVAGRQAFWGRESAFSGDPVIVRIPMADDVWELAARPTVGWRNEVEAECRWFLLAGLVIGALLAAIAWLLARRHTSLSQTVSQRDRELEAQHALLEAVVEGANDALFIKDIAGRYLIVNETCTRLFGKRRDEIIGRDDHELMSPDDAEGVLATDAKVRQTGQPLTVEETLTLVGGRRTFSTTKNPFRDASGAVIGIIGVARDVTEVKQREEALHAAELKSLRAQRLEALGTLAGGIAHDINNALAPILMAVGALREEYEKESELLDMVGASARRAADMVKQLLGFARGRAGERVPLQVGLVVNELRGLIGSSFPKNIEIVSQLEHDLPLVSGDSTQVLQVLTNLCVNARDAMADGGTLTVRARRQQVDEAFAAGWEGARVGTYVVVSVTDSGHGIPSELLTRVFEPFFSTKGLAKGTGLGLSTALGLVRGHDGFMVAESTPGVGTTMSVYLPALTGPSEAQKAVVSTPESEAGGHGETVLFVDDELPVLGVVRTVLGRLGYRVLTAESGEAALRLVALHRSELKALITDVHMPKMDGLALVRAVREHLPDLPVALVSGGLSEAEGQAIEGLGISARLGKPFTEQELCVFMATLVHSETHNDTGAARTPR